MSPERVRRLVWLALAAVAVAYGVVAALQTVWDFDFGWTIATGRHIIHHNTIPDRDVFSYTARGAEFIYPILPGIIFYAAYTAGGYSAVTWFSVAACSAVIVLVLLAVPGRPIAAALAVIAVPEIAVSTAARADLFSTVFFAAFLCILWRHYRGLRTWLWLLPVLMILWVNLHLGFIAGLALLFAYTAVDLLELLSAARRGRAMERLRLAAPWLAATVVATVLNPWGPRIYVAIWRQNRILASLADFVGYWRPTQFSLATPTEALAWRNPETCFWWLLAVSMAAFLLALVKREWGTAMLLAVAAVIAMRHWRFQGLFVVLSAVTAGSLFSAFDAPARLQFLRRRVPGAGAIVLLAAMLWLTGVRVSDLASNRHYLSSGAIATFGAGLSWWFPEAATAFLLREKLPRNIFHDYNMGGYLTWRLSPDYPVFVDGRAIPFGPRLFFKQQELIHAPPDSPHWRRQADAFDIQTLIFSTSRYGGLGSFPLREFCDSEMWQAVYLDETAVIFLRRAPQNAPWLERLKIDCATVPLSPPQTRDRALLYNFYANAGSVLYVLSRDEESWDYLERARKLYAHDANLYLARGQLLQARGRVDEASREYSRSVSLKETDAAWYALGRLQATQHQYAAAAESIRRAAARSLYAHDRYRALGQVYLAMKEPRRALDAFDRAESRSPFRADSAALGYEFSAQVAEGRARAWKALGNESRATVFQQQADQARARARELAP